MNCRALGCLWNLALEGRPQSAGSLGAGVALWGHLAPMTEGCPVFIGAQLPWRVNSDPATRLRPLP